MRNNYSAADHDPGDEDPTEQIKRALLEEDPIAVIVAIVETPPRHAMSQMRATPLLDVPFASSPWPWLV